MKVLFLHSNRVDYLSEGLFHGLRVLLGENCVDVPRHDSMYAPLTDSFRSRLRGGGFTLYGLLEDIPELAEARYFWEIDLDSYDLIVIANIWEQWQLFEKLSSRVKPEKLAILDGQDPPPIFPYSYSNFLKRPWLLFTKISQFKYFKREMFNGVYSRKLDQFLPPQLHEWIPDPKNIIPISFSIPEEKIWEEKHNSKIKDFPVYMVDKEVASNISESVFSDIRSDNYCFFSEEEYYLDLRQSRFGITTKRGGWDCLRHYELAANGCVLCFRDLDLKPKNCAPHGLNESNCIIYHNYQELIEKTSSLTTEEYLQLQEASYQWIKINSTKVRAKEFLQACSEF
ncbi:hypothetical protein [Trichormus sp. NMC-1]|uniref:hypothetical protein n=1 Tax=Trichormus sp. NMC-1 TaxID=1853259 RepID=UPI0008DBFBA7|nr:hypothetical protein [Trichormus sp. NMC-1]